LRKMKMLGDVKEVRYRHLSEAFMRRLVSWCVHLRVHARATRKSRRV